jgi:hypothetical protein
MEVLGFEEDPQGGVAVKGLVRREVAVDLLQRGGAKR